MNLVDDYLRAVAGHLPKAGREDILAELRDLILTRIEAREAGLGRTLSLDETETLLREVGHPLVVAARYGAGPQHVVGPALYPYWLFGVKAALAITGAVILVGLLVRLGSGQSFSHEIAQAFGGAVQAGLVIVGAATAAAWLMERRYVKGPDLDSWRVKDLRVLELAAWDLDGWREQARAAWRPARGFAEARPRGASVSSAVTDIASGLVFLLWWVGAIHIFGGGVDDLREVGLEPGGLAGFDWPALKAMIFAPCLIYATAVMGQGLYTLARPDDRRVRGVFNLLIGAGVLGLSGWLMWGSPLAPHAAVNSLVELVATARATFEDGAPFRLAGMVTIILAGSLFGGAVRTLKGAAQILAPRSALSPTAPA